MFRQDVENPMVLDHLWNDEPKVIGTDALGNEIFAGDEVYEYESELFVIEELSHDAREILQLLGATKKTA
ncbi:hypothetical protein [Siminovitchia sp. FSL W7-1587]|uniref:hypothetical protein n=1 Tax=Siminovitchia sp. FSL W7-1587 TaxID=2954699 RepID=UPI0030CD5E7D